MTRRHWFLPQTPNFARLLSRQGKVTLEGVEAFARWSAGDASAADLVRDAERRGDEAKRELLNALRAAFVTPLEPEDLFALSRQVDWILNYVRDLVSESEAMACPPDGRLADMAMLLRDAVRHLDIAIAQLELSADAATDAADAALRAERELEHAYYRGMAALLDAPDGVELVARRELYRRCVRIGETVVDTAERVVYAVMKQS